LLDLPLGAAVLLGAVLAPTDPVLASDVQVTGPRDRDHLRFTLTGEAGLNDGTAFPFVVLGLGLLGLDELGTFGWRWFAIDVLWAFMRTPAGVTYMFLMTRARGRIEPLGPGSDIPELSDVYHPNDVELRRIPRPQGIILGPDLSGRGWLCAEISAEHLHKRRPERAVEQIEADMELLAAMNFLELHRVRLNGKDTRVAKLGEWVVDEPPDGG
jgi:hypothetical protein